MPETTDQLMNDARCIDKCIPDGMKLAVLISIFQQLLTNGTGGGGGGGTITEQETVVPVAGTNIDWSLGTLYTITLAASITLTFSNVSTKTIKVRIVGDASHTVTWPAMKWPGGVAPVQTLSKVDYYTLISADGVNVDGTAVQNLS